MLTITIDRTSLTLAPLVITGSRTTAPSGMWVPENGLQLPTPEPRRTYAPTSAYVRRQLLAVVFDGGDLIATVRVQGSPGTSLAVRRATLEAAVSQFLFTVTVDIDGIAVTGEGECSWPQWVAPTASDRLLDRARCQLAIPVTQ